MKLLFHSLRKDLRQNIWPLGLLLVLIFLRVFGQSSDYCESIINPLFYDLMLASETVIIIGYLGFCGFIGFQEAPANREHYLATRPLPLFAKLGSKLLLVALLYGVIVSGEYYTAYAWQLDPGNLAVRLSPLLFTGWALLFFGSIWSSPSALALGCLIIAPIVLTGLWALTLLNDQFDLSNYDPNYMVLSFLFCVSLFVFFLVAHKLRQLLSWALLPAIPVAMSFCFFLAFNIPPETTSAPPGTLQKAFNQPVEKSLRIHGNSLIKALSYGSPQLNPLYVVEPMAKSISVLNGSETIHSASNAWENDIADFHSRGVDQKQLVKKFIRPEQIDYIASKYANGYFVGKRPKNYETLTNFEMPESMTEGELIYRISLSHKIREYRKIARLPIIEGASSQFGNSTFSVVHTQGFDRSSGSYGRLSISQRSVGDISDDYLNKRRIAIFNSISQAPAAVDSGDSFFTSRFGFLKRSLIKFDFYADPVWDTKEKPEDRRIDLYAWVYLGVEDSPPIELTRSIEKPAGPNEGGYRTPVYPVLHSTQY